MATAKAISSESPAPVADSVALAADDSTPRIMAAAAAFGIEVAPDLLEPAKADAETASAAALPAVAEAGGSGRVIAIAVSLVGPHLPVPSAVYGPPAPPAPPVVASVPARIAARDTTPVPHDGAKIAAERISDAETVTMIASPSEAPRGSLPAEPALAPIPQADADATAEKLEAALLSQLRSLEETLQDSPVALPSAAPAAARTVIAPRPVMPRLAEPAGAPGRSPFAPDPVRQRTYVDLRDPAPAPEATDDAPWRKYLEPSRPVSRPAAPVRRPPAARPSPRPAPAGNPFEATPAERSRGIRAMSAAAVLGLGVGIGLLLLARPLSDPPSATAAVDVPAEPAVAAAVAAADDAAAGQANRPVNQALATLLADPPAMRAKHAGPAVIAEAGTPPEALAAAAMAPAAPVAAPPVIRPPPGQPLQVARMAPAGGRNASVPLAYGPVAPTFDPVAQSLLRETAEEAATEEAEPATASEAPPARPAASAGGRATVNSFVNMRAEPDNGAAVVAVLAQGLSVKILDCDYWCEIEAGGKRGYVYKKFVGR